MHRTLLRLAIACVLVVVGWGSSASAWDTTAGNDTNYGSITFGGTNHDGSYEVAVDGAGNVYTTGYFRNTVDFGAGNVTSAGNADVFVTKLNAAGAHQWTTTFGGTGNDYGHGVAVDGSGNVHVTGYFQNTVDFGAGNVTSAGQDDVFVTKLNAAGAHQWTTTFGGTGNDNGHGVAVDGSGNVYTTGNFKNTVDFGAGNVTATGGNNDVFVTKLNSSGAHQWTTTFGNISGDQGYGVAVDSSGNVYATGVFGNTVNFGAGNVTAAGNSDVFVTKLNSSGVHQWTTTFGGTGVDYSYGVAVDGDSNVYTTGWFYGTVDFGAGNVTSAGQADVFVTKLNAAGAHQWTTTFGGTGVDHGWSVAVDGSGNVYTTGRFEGTVDFGAGNVTSAGSHDVFVTKLNSAGAHQWTTTFGGTGADYGLGVAADGSGNVHGAGNFIGTVDFGAGDVTSVGGAIDGFVVKLNSAGQAVVAPGGGGGGGGGT
ncbi:MAG: SBBP repeat-containing protein, partial [Actinomycetota bacterium]|nr:SBBP repeat-containing protein [Actinomycetota bacterium]